jgi:Domain of unknown function (DUF4129)
MGCRRGLLILWSILLCAPAFAEQPPVRPPGTLTVSEYVAKLVTLISAVKELARPEEVPKLLNDIPSAWRIEATERTFEVSAEWLRQDLSDWQKKPSPELQEQMVSRLELLHSETISFQTSPADTSQKRELLNGILAGQEFRNIHGPTWLDRFEQKLLEMLIRLLGRVFQSSAIPTIGNAVVYGLMAAALLAVAYWMYRTIKMNAGVEAIAPISVAVSSKGWKIWMKEARIAADGGNWRDAIHFGYWCGISFLEAQGMWRPDTARTPREYLRLLSSSSEHREALGTLTRTFELVWYGRQEADANAFAETLAQLEKLGCQFN